MITNLHYKLILVFLYSAFATYVASIYFLHKFKKKGYVVPDIYKKDKRLIANLGGTAALVGVMIAIVLSILIVREFSTSSILLFYFIIIVFAVFGLIDDLIVTNNTLKIIAPFFMALPIALLTTDTNLIILGYGINLGVILLYLIAPIYILVVTNLVNMHSGFNGLASGTSWILMLALSVRAYLMAGTDLLFYLFPIFGALTVLCYFDKYPAKMIWGNIGSMMIGAAIGLFIIVSKAEIFGIIILIPHIIDFILYLWSVIVQKKKFESIKYGKLRKDNTIAPPTPLKLKFLLPYYFRLTEKQTVWIMYGFTAIFCIIGLLVGI